MSPLRPLRLLSQGMTRPGVVYGPCYAPRRPTARLDPYRLRPEWIDGYRPTPARRPDPRLSHPRLR